MHDEKNSNVHAPAPVTVLAEDVELRPRNAEGASLGQLLQPRMHSYLQQLEETLAELRKLAEQAPGIATRASIEAKVADLLVKITRLGQRACGDFKTPSDRQIRHDDVPDWSQLSPEVQNNLSYWLDRAQHDMQNPHR